MDKATRATAFDLVASQPWAIQPEMLATIAAIARRENDDVQSVEARLGRPLQNAQTVTVRDGVALVPVTGPIMRYANLFTQVSGATSLDLLARDFTAAVDNPAVKHIVLVVDSPGGQANGIAEFAAMVRASVKPVTAYVDGTAASAAYWIASAAGQIVMGKSAIVGSIGAVLSLDTKTDPNAVEIVSSQSPNKRPDVRTDAGRAQIQTLIDALAQVFVDDVAAYRGVAAQTVLDQFGQGAMFVGADAVARGMADRLGTLETLLAGLSGTTAKGAIMAHENGSPAAEKPVIDRAYLAANHVDLMSSLMAEGALAERVRIQAVQAQAKGFPGHDDLVAGLIADGQTTGPEAALAILAAERAKGADRVAALRADAPAPVGFAAAPADDPLPDDDDQPIEARAQAAWDKDKALRAEFGTFDTYLAYAKATAEGRVKVLGNRK